jgi:hypothetical protein
MFAARLHRLPRKRNGRPETAGDNGQRFHAEDRAPKGPVKLDKYGKYGMVVQTMYVRETEKVDGGMGHRSRSPKWISSTGHPMSS